MMTRREAREHIFKLLFAFSFQPKAEAAALLSLYEENFIEEKLRAKELSFIREMALSCWQMREELDQKIESHLVDWKISRIARTDLSILRLALYEIEHREDIPPKVSINEAVELCKLYSPESSPAYVNGVLSNFIRESGQ